MLMNWEDKENVKRSWVWRLEGGSACCCFSLESRQSQQKRVNAGTDHDDDVNPRKEDCIERPIGRPCS